MPRQKTTPTFDEYIAAQLEWSEYSQRKWADGGGYSVSVNNRLAKRSGAMHASLRSDPRWPEMLEAMANHPSAHIRIIAAHDIFDADPDRALAMWSEIEHGPYGLSFEAHWAAQGRLNRRGIPEPAIAVSVEVEKDPSTFHPDRERIADAVLAFHGATMNGGFLTAFAVVGDRLRDAIQGFEQIGLEPVADLLRSGASLFPCGVLPENSVERQRAVDELIDAAALEALDGPYDALVPDDTFLGDRLDRYLDA